MKTIATSDGSPSSSLQATGGESAGNVSEQENIKVCPYRYLGCVSEEGGRCYSEVCEPLDADGNRFAVRVTEAHGQKFYAKVYDRILNAEEIQRARVQLILKRQDEPLATWRSHVGTFTEEAL